MQFKAGYSAKLYSTLYRVEQPNPKFSSPNVQDILLLQELNAQHHSDRNLWVCLRSMLGAEHIVCLALLLSLSILQSLLCLEPCQFLLDVLLHARS